MDDFSRTAVSQKLELFLQGRKPNGNDEAVVENQPQIQPSNRTLTTESEEGFESQKVGSCCSRQVKKTLVMCSVLKMVCMLSALILFSGMPEFVAIKASFAATALVGGVGVVAGLTLIAIIIYSVVKCIQEPRRTYYEITD